MISNPTPIIYITGQPNGKIHAVASAVARFLKGQGKGIQRFDNASLSPASAALIQQATRHFDHVIVTTSQAPDAPGQTIIPAEDLNLSCPNGRKA